MLQISTLPEKPGTLPDMATDSVTGLPARKTALQNFQRVLQAGRAQRYTATLVQLVVSAGEKASGADRTLQDLTVYRAADALQRSFLAEGLLGRVSQSALLLIRPQTTMQQSATTADQVRNALGSLGGIIDTRHDLHINTLNISSSSMSASEAVERLERRCAAIV